MTTDNRAAEMLDAIRQAMADQGIKQSELAAAIGCQQPQISAYLRGRKEPGITKLVELAAAVGCVWRLERE